MNNDIPTLSDSNLAVVHYNTQTCIGGWPAMDDYYALMLVLNGSSICTVDNYCFKLNASNLYLLKHRKENLFEQTSHDFKCDIVLFKKNFLASTLLGEPLLHNFLGDNQEEPIISSLDKRGFHNIRSIFQRLDHEYRSKKLFHAQMLRLLFVELLIEAGRSSIYTPAPVLALPSRQQHLVQQYSALIDQYYLTDRTVQAYADRLFVSAKYLSEVVKEHTGQPALHLIHQRILREAKYWLHVSGMSIKEIAVKLNFDTGSHFSRFFKHISGINPTDYQRMAIF
ncbi:AraC-type DNA-binding protein [bacterium A37T11]|nr:AraC-type DNA-binding protein [bacterium A37T11]